ncbi:carbohydrate-binding domain-containing protein [Jonesia quinghaiensis]|uniref:carbohydrate-binding domain-containing protein n=1 Tax=Jonesia quinghaiensis TaxID=262806 RepID=UPI00041C30FC|nr:carbohydrate-binding domain-containing protein [Jonesia quinghaiensis]
MTTFRSPHARRGRRVAALMSAAALAASLAACAPTDTSAAAESTTQSTETTTTATVVDPLSIDATQTATEVLAANEELHSVEEVDTSAAVTVDLSSSDQPDGVTSTDGNITISQQGTYRLTGELEGSVLLDAADAKVTLILDGVTITSTQGAALAATAIDELTISLAEGRTNTLTDSATYDESADPNAALYSAGNTTITGTGSLTVVGNYNDGITSKDGLIIESGDITVTAVDDAVRGKDYIAVTGGSLHLTAGGDGMTSDNDTDADRGFIALHEGATTIVADGDGIAAATDVVMTGGTIDITTGVGSGSEPSDDTSTKGVKSGVITVIEDGVISVDAQDDALHSDGAMGILGGTITLASGDDGIHAEGTFHANAGTVVVTSSYEGIEAYHIDLAGADIDVTASDDGLNAAGDATTGEVADDAATTDDTAPQAEQPTDQPVTPDGDAEEVTPPSGNAETGERPERPSGDMGERPEGDTATRPSGGGGGMGGGMDAAGDYSITISAGTVNVTAGGDGLDSNGSLTISGGVVRVDGPTTGGNGSLDVNGEFAVEGGELVTLGTADMPVYPGDGSQAWLSLAELGASAGDEVSVTDSDGNVVLNVIAEVSSDMVMYSGDNLVAGQSYTVTVNGTEVGTATAS